MKNLKRLILITVDMYICMYMYNEILINDFFSESFCVLCIMNYNTYYKFYFFQGKIILNAIIERKVKFYIK